MKTELNLADIGKKLEALGKDLQNIPQSWKGEECLRLGAVAKSIHDLADLVTVFAVLNGRG